MNLRITSIDVVGPDRRARRLVFDVADPRTTAGAVVKSLGIAADDAWDSDDLEAALSDEERRLAYERALRLLGYRDRTAFELTSRLQADGYPENVSVVVVERLCELGLVDDERFATAWATSRRAAGVGRCKTHFELIRRGIAEGLADEALDATMPADAELERARAMAQRTTVRTRKDRERLVRRLVTRGFDLRTAAHAAGEAERLGLDGDAADDLPIP